MERRESSFSQKPANHAIAFSHAKKTSRGEVTGLKAEYHFTPSQARLNKAFDILFEEAIRLMRVED